MHMGDWKNQFIISHLDVIYFLYKQYKNAGIHFFVIDFVKSGYFLNVVKVLFKVFEWHATIHSISKIMDNIIVKHESCMISSTSIKASEKVIGKKNSD